MSTDVDRVLLSLQSQPEKTTSSEADHINHSNSDQAMLDGSPDQTTNLSLPHVNTKDSVMISTATQIEQNGGKKKSVKKPVDSRGGNSLELQGLADAISKAMAVIEFNLDGTIITANENLLHTLGYTLEEVQGQHHRMFVEPAFAQSAEYREFWAKLNRGEYESKEYKRIGKGGKEVSVVPS